MTLTIAIPDEVASELGDSEPKIAARVQSELALAYYEGGLISAGRAAEMSGLTRGGFETLLSTRGALRNYSREDWINDLAETSDSR